jgi:xanthine dehydrogenase molybdopterin-binding subunit B
MIIADTQVNADAAADAVVVTYGAPIQPIVLTLEDAINRRQFFPDNQWQKGPAPIVRGDVDKGFAESARVMSQRVVMGSQAHLYVIHSFTLVLDGIIVYSC